MFIISVVFAFVAGYDVTYIDDRSVIDCVNRYREGSNEYHFIIKVPKGISLSDVIIGFTDDSGGTVQMYGNTIEIYNRQ